MEVVLDSETLGLISLFEKMTKARVRDCIPVEWDDRVIFVVEKGNLRKAIGKRGEKIRRVREKIKKIVDVVEYSPDPKRFIKNIFHNHEVREVKIENGANGPTAYVKIDPKDKGRAIGKGGRNLRLVRKVLARHHQEIGNLMIL